ncbi:MAG: toxin FitB [Solirubrobacterales bacterium]|nr:toxin FitB [Solirubrobacterales bacterium]
MKAVLDTSILIDGQSMPPEVAVSISAISIAELHFGIESARDEEVRQRRISLLGLVESRFPRPLPLDDRAARVLGQLKATVRRRGGNPRAKMADLAIAATAVANEAVLITLNPRDLSLVKDLVQVRVPA